MKARSTNRREFFTSFFKPLRETSASPVAVIELQRSPEATLVATTVAIVQGRFCLAYQNSFCSTCIERCPVPGAIISERGLPRIDPAICTGCRICHEVCPAPRNAILLAPRRPAKAVHTP